MVTIWISIDKKQIDFSVLIFQQEFTRQLGFGFYHSSPEIQFVQRYSQVEKTGWYQDRRLHYQFFHDYSFSFV